MDELVRRKAVRSLRVVKMDLRVAAIFSVIGYTMLWLAEASLGSSRRWRLRAQARRQRTETEIAANA